MRKWVVLLVAGATALTAPTVAIGQLPPVPTVPPVPVPVPTVPPAPVPVPTVPPLPKPPPVPVPKPPPLPVPSPPSVSPVPGPVGGGSSGGGSTSGGGSSSSGGGATGSSSSPAAAAPGAASGGSAGSSASRGSAARARAARSGGGARTPAQRHRAERRLRRAVARLSGCLGRLTSFERRVLVLRTGLGDARPHSRRGVARLLDVRVRRVVRIERRGLRQARSLERAGACSRTSVGNSAGADASTVLTTDGGDNGGGGLVTAPSQDSGASGDQGASGGSSTGTGEVRGEHETQLPPPLGGGGTAEPGGISLAIGIFLILLALVAGFAAPHVRGRLRSS